MARRSYTRDARGRFASTPGGGARKAVKLPAPARRTAGSKPQKRRGLLIQRSAAAASKRKLKGLDPADQSLSGSLKRRAQKGAATRTANRLKAAESGGRIRLAGRKAPGRIGAKAGRTAEPRVAKPKPPAKEAARPAKPKRSRAKSAPGDKSQPVPRLNGRDWGSLMRLKGFAPIDNGRGPAGYFVPDSSLTPRRRKKLGLDASKTQVDGANFSVQRQSIEGREGWFIIPKAPRGETPPQLQRRKSSLKPKTADDLMTQATRIEQMGRRMSRAARTGARDTQIEERATRAVRAARQRAFEMEAAKQKPPSKAELKRQWARLNAPTTWALNARLAADYYARNRR
jgi:hypothetical protein